MGLRHSRVGNVVSGGSLETAPTDPTVVPGNRRWSRKFGAGLGARVLLPPASINQRSGAVCVMGSPILSPCCRKSQSCHTGGNVGEQEFLSGCSSHQLILLTKHLAAPLPPWQPLGCSLQRCLRAHRAPLCVLCRPLRLRAVPVWGSGGAPMSDSLLNHSWPSFSKRWKKRWSFKRGNRVCVGSEG